MEIDRRAFGIGRDVCEPYEGEKVWTVYLLVDPRDGLPHYVGATSNIEARIGAHKRAKGENKRHKWLKELKELGLSFEFVPVGEYWYRQHAYHCEAMVINKGFEKGWPLTNSQKYTKSTDGMSWDQCGEHDTGESVSLPFFRIDANAICLLTVPIRAYAGNEGLHLQDFTYSAKCGFHKVEPDRDSLRLWKYYEEYIIALGWYTEESPYNYTNPLRYRYVFKWWHSRYTKRQGKRN